MVRRIAIVGGGVSGLTAAFRLRRRLGPDADIHLYEAGTRLGGTVSTVDVGGQMVDVGAEAFIVRRPEARELVTELGLADRIVSPTTARPAVWADGGLHDLPRPALMGIPATPEAVSGLADPADVERIRTEGDRPWRWDVHADPSVGELVGDRYGSSVVERSVDPMLGGVYSSLAADIGVREALPALAAALDAGAAGLRAAVTGLVGVPTPGRPVFGTLVGGYRVLVDALVDAAEADIRLCSAVTGLRSGSRGWRLSGSRDVTDDETVYDGVVLAVPAWISGRILRGVAPSTSTILTAVQRASSVVVSLAFGPGTALPSHSGVLVATGEDLHAKAFTFSSQKWAHLGRDGGPVSVRASFGRFGQPVPDECVEHGVDERIIAEAIADLDRVCHAAGVVEASPRLLDARLQRWTNGLPRYAPGHLAAMADALRHRPPGVALAGAAYAGVGVPACIGEAGRAVDDLLSDLGADDPT